MRVPKGEVLWKTFLDSSGSPRFIITSKEKDRSWYFLYRVENDTIKKLGKAEFPPELEEKYKVEKEIGARPSE